MRILLLGNSNDGGQWFEGGRKRHEIVQERLSALYGGPVEVIAKGTWPNAGMPRAVEGWIEKHEPDVVYLTTVNYWFNYPSVPLRVRRFLGRMGPRVSDAGFKLADSRRWSHNAAFRGVRSLFQRTIGGDPHFTADEIVERITEVIRLALRHEGVVLAIQGPDGRNDYSHSKRGRQRQEARRLMVHGRLEAFCAQHHVTYDNSVVPIWETDPVLGANRVGDGLHGNARWHERAADLVCATILRALEEAAQPVPGAATAAR
ncbi:MAG: hypothetical protein HY875_12340 [Chloroflexi bacterium]|nr:hypothetical protein [Chloroflexota bacterium]